MLNALGNVTTAFFHWENSKDINDSPARFDPCGVAINEAGDLFITDQSNHCIRVARGFCRSCKAPVTIPSTEQVFEAQNPVPSSSVQNPMPPSEQNLTPSPSFAGRHVIKAAMTTRHVKIGIIGSGRVQRLLCSMLTVLDRP